MRVGHYVPQAWVATGRGSNVSGHIQVASKSAELMRNAGYDVELITHPRLPGQERPACVRADMVIHTVPDAWHRGGELGFDETSESRLRPTGLMAQLRAMRRICRQRNVDLLHLHGRYGTVRLGALVARTLPGVPIVVSAIEAAPEEVSAVERRLLRGIDAVLTPSQTVAASYRSIGMTAHIVAHGAVRDLGSDTTAPRHRVLFWREANHQNGGDLCIEAFDRLAPSHPNTSFDLALRPFWKETPGVDDLAGRHDNVTVHRFPYPDGVDLEQLVSEALVVVLPFRSLTMEPQMAVLESVLAGAPVVVSDVGSNSEIVGASGAVVPPGDVDAIVSVVAHLLDDPSRTIELGRAGAETARSTWTWDGYAANVESVYRQLAG